jgi:hypothetical protein
MLCIRSEHAIGFLKGRFQSLKNLRLHIKDQVSHVIANIGSQRALVFMLLQSDTKKKSDTSTILTLTS